MSVDAYADLAARVEASFAAAVWDVDADAVEEAIGLLDRGEVRVAEPDGRRLGRQRVGEEGGPAVLPHPRHGDDRVGTVRVPRQAAVQARVRRRPGVRVVPPAAVTVRRVPVARA